MWFTIIKVIFTARVVSFGQTTVQFETKLGRHQCNCHFEKIKVGTSKKKRASLSLYKHYVC